MDSALAPILLKSNSEIQGDSMTIRLVKQGEATTKDEKPAQPSLETQLILTTQGWIEEFKARKARTRQSLAVELRRI
jgi:hypothetical protein